MASNLKISTVTQALIVELVMAYLHTVFAKDHQAKQLVKSWVASTNNPTTRPDWRVREVTLRGVYSPPKKWMFIPELDQSLFKFGIPIYAAIRTKTLMRKGPTGHISKYLGFVYDETRQEQPPVQFHVIVDRSASPTLDSIKRVDAYKKNAPSDYRRGLPISYYVEHPDPRQERKDCKPDRWQPIDADMWLWYFRTHPDADVETVISDVLEVVRTAHQDATTQQQKEDDAVAAVVAQHAGLDAAQWRRVLGRLHAEHVALLKPRGIKNKDGKEATQQFVEKLLETPAEQVSEQPPKMDDLRECFGPGVDEIFDAVMRDD